jgi:hypothetical protein
MHVRNLHFTVYDANCIVYLSANETWVIWMFCEAGNFPTRKRPPRHCDNSATLSHDMRNESCLLVTKWHSQENSPVTGNEELKRDRSLKKKAVLAYTVSWTDRSYTTVMKKWRHVICFGGRLCLVIRPLGILVTVQVVTVSQATRTQNILVEWKVLQTSDTKINVQ